MGGTRRSAAEAARFAHLEATVVKVRLEVVDGPETGRHFVFEEADSFVIGRSPRAHLILDPNADPFVSRAHCMVDVRPPRCLLRDLDSTNGTTLNGRRVERAELEDGDEIGVGRTRVAVAIDRAAPALGQDRADLRMDEPLVSGGPGGVQEPGLGIATEAPCAAPGELAPVCAGCGRDVSSHIGDDPWRGESMPGDRLCPPCAARERRGGPEPSRLGSFTLLNEIGRGGMGVVYRAVHEPSRRLCAIKRILPEHAADEHSRRLFDREVGVQSMVVHPNLVRVLERGQDGPACFFALEYLAGGDAGGLVSRAFRGPVPPRLAVHVILQVLAGVGELHRHGFVHRDLKPGNILLDRRPDQGEPVAKVTDYGLAKSFEEAGNSLFDYTRLGEAAGSMLFMPPEQILDFRFVRPAADVYAVGVTLYYLLTARYSVQSPMAGGVGSHRVGGNPIAAILDEPAVPVRERRAELPAMLAAVVDRAVAKDLGTRYPSAQAFRTDLAAAAASLGWNGA